MPGVVALLRAVNVGNRRMKMERLREVFEAQKMRDVQTYLQSGNVVFRTSSSDLVAVRRKLESAIEKEFGFYSETILRTAEEMRAVVAGNPFAGREDVLPAKLLVHFLSGPPPDDAAMSLSVLKTDGEELRLDLLSLYVHYPNGVGVSKVGPRIDRTLRVATTGRNWNSVTKLLEMAEQIS